MIEYRNSVKLLFDLAVFTAVQLIVGNYVGDCYTYIGAFICMPWRRLDFVQLIVAVIIGLVIDVTCLTTTLHTLSLVLVVFLKHEILLFVLPKSINTLSILIRDLGVLFVLLLDLILCSTYHVILFFVDGGVISLSMFYACVQCILISTLVVFLYQLSIQVFTVCCRR